MERSDSQPNAGRVLALRERVAQLKARQVSSRPPSSSARANGRRKAVGGERNTVDGTGPCAGILRDEALERLDSLVQLQVNLGPASDSNLFVGFSQDVGRGGVLICTHEHPELNHDFGRRVAVTMSFPGGQETRALGFIRFARTGSDVEEDNRPGLGVQFLSLTEAGHELVRRFAAHREPIFYSD